MGGKVGLPRQGGPQNLLQYLDLPTRRIGGLNKLLRTLGGETPGPVFGGEDIQEGPELLGLAGSMKIPKPLRKFGVQDILSQYERKRYNALPPGVGKEMWEKTDSLSAENRANLYLQVLQLLKGDPNDPVSGVVKRGGFLGEDSLEKAAALRLTRDLNPQGFERLFSKGGREKLARWADEWLDVMHDIPPSP